MFSSDHEHSTCMASTRTPQPVGRLRFPDASITWLDSTFVANITGSPSAVVAVSWRRATAADWDAGRMESGGRRGGRASRGESGSSESLNNVLYTKMTRLANSVSLSDYSFSFSRKVLSRHGIWPFYPCLSFSPIELARLLSTARSFFRQNTPNATHKRRF